MSSTDGFGGNPSVFARFFGDVFQMPVWQKWMLSLATLIGGAGLAGKTYTAVAPSTAQTATAQNRRAASDNPTAPQAPAGSSGIVSQAAPTGPESQAAPGLPPPEPTLVETHSPWMSRVGLGFVAGFVIGWAFRVFIKTMMIVTVLGVALLMGLSYFHIVNVDLSRARTEYADNIAWVTDQAVKIRDLAVSYLPTSGISMTGLVVGFKKK